MRSLRPDSRGILTSIQPTIRTGSHIHAYTRPSRSLPSIDRMRNGEPPRIALTRKQGGLGDVLMTLPTVKAISSKYNTQIDYGTDFGYLDGALAKVLEHNNYIKDVFQWEDIKGDNYDAIIDLTCPCIAHEKPGASPINRIDLFANYCGVKLHNYEIDYKVTDEETEWAEEYMAESNLSQFKLILIHPFSSTTRRNIPADILKQSLIKILSSNRNLRAIIVTHDDKASDWNYSGMHVFNNFDVRHIAAIMAQCSLVVCPDSSLLHLAAALHMPTISLFGPTDPRARINYHPEAIAIWVAKELSCKCCWYSGCVKGYVCWKRLEEDVLSRSITSMLQGSPLPLSRDLITFGSYEIENQYYQIL